MMTAVAGFLLAIGAAIAALWTVLLVRHQGPEIVEGRRDIYFHIAAELVTAALLIGAGSLLLPGAGDVASGMAAAGLGALLYTLLNSPGHYAERREWGPVTAFLALSAVTVAVGIAVLA